ncbi:MAG: bifunctional (p)ppGpp synthetase/guanosine-3',5'-bis(diphosphate) 3'-pyrophosphohydrolase [Bdellovibrionales bacterium]|nr:bifunctional (p)ppGpp synthetase/guanosine-3',5'-bis(diphosphate) 3'-pyrophosphohydrolase [Bdellovibrionales bacterium]
MPPCAPGCSRGWAAPPGRAVAKHETPTLDMLCNQVLTYYPDVNVELIRKAYDFADRHHKGQTRASGDPYIIHPTEVAYTLADMKLDLASVLTGLLHDTVEDTPATQEDIKREFGDEVAELVEGVTKLSKMTFRTSEEKQAENFRKMIVAMAKDIRVILVKLADRLNNMRTLEHLADLKRKQIAQETLDIYAPIANRLGISWIKTELEDLCLRWIHPDVYSKLSQRVAKTRGEREKFIDEVCEIIREKLTDYDIKADIQGRAKHFHSIFKKMERRGVDYDQIYDVVAFRIVVENITECYKALGVIHATYKPVPGRFKDYIAMPKANNYQSLHTTVIGPYGERVEIQIRTQEMNQVAESGIAAHWQYKEGRFHTRARENVAWVSRLMEWQKDLSDPNEFLETVKIDLFAEDVFVFTPKGEVKQLPYGATCIDFAFAIHTEVGNKCIGAKVNGKIVPLKYKLKSGDTLEIITSATQSPSKDWLKIAKTSRAKAKIRAFIKKQERDRARDLGREILDKSFRRMEHSLNKLEKAGRLNNVMDSAAIRTPEELYVAVGYGRMTPDDVVRRVLPKEEWEAKQPLLHKEEKAEEDKSFLKKVFRSAARKSEARNAIQVANLDDVLIRFAKCCSPVPGDSIVGFITRGRGVTVHAASCPKALDIETERRVDVRWNILNKESVRTHARIRVLSNDTPGLLAMMSQTIASCGVNIASANVRTTKDRKAVATFDVEVTGTEQLNKVISALEAKKGVITAQRTRS